MDKKDILRILYKSADLYKANLMNTNLLILSQSYDNYNYIQCAFRRGNFSHLTGINHPYAPVEFFNMCIDRRLNINELTMKTTTEKKLHVLENLMKINTNAKMIGNYNESKIILYTEKLIGTTNSCLGFVYNEKYKTYDPNTTLKEDIRNITIKPTEKILAIFQKELKDKIYSKLSYINKDFHLDLNKFEKDIYKMIDISNIVMPTNTQQNKIITNNIEYIKEKLVEAGYSPTPDLINNYKKMLSVAPDIKNVQDIKDIVKLSHEVAKEFQAAEKKLIKELNNKYPEL